MRRRNSAQLGRVCQALVVLRISNVSAASCLCLPGPPSVVGLKDKLELSHTHWCLSLPLYCMLGGWHTLYAENLP